MENQWALHPSTTVAKRWISDTDIYYPCDDPRIKPQWEVGCWMNQASLMYNVHFHGDIRKTSDACLAVKDPTYQQTCFNNLARQLHPLTNGQLIPAIRMCDQFDPTWQDYCLTSIAVSDFANGGRDLAYKICPVMEDEHKPDCYDQLFGTMLGYSTSRADMELSCAPITDNAYRLQCLNTK